MVRKRKKRESEKEQKTKLCLAQSLPEQKSAQVRQNPIDASGRIYNEWRKAAQIDAKKRTIARLNKELHTASGSPAAQRSATVPHEAPAFRSLHRHTSFLRTKSMGEGDNVTDITAHHVTDDSWIIT